MRRHALAITDSLVTGATGGLDGQVTEFLLRRVPYETISTLERDLITLHPFAEKDVQIHHKDYRDKTGPAMTLAGS